MGSIIDDQTNIPATNEKAKNIKALDKNSVHRICSGQVVLSLAIAVKELLENAVDAGATTVEIRLKEYGSELIEVIDNGSGVEECNFAGLTLKHYTSKIQQFEDLLSVTTFGFRGEALSSLTALSKLSITTRHSSCEFAHRIDYDNSGKIIKKVPCARPVGTTVTLANLFYTLPVRHKEFQKNLKREFTKMCNLLYSYCLISTGVKIICTNVTNKGSRSTVAATQATNSIKDNISCIFGHSQLVPLIEIEQTEPSTNICEEYSIKMEHLEIPFEICGYISNCKPGCGRSAQDRQFYYVNSRPCEIPKLSKLVNEVYHQFNNAQYPFVLLNIKIKTSLVDINVTPDKRKLFLNNEKILLAVIKTSLLTLFKKHAPCFDTSNAVLTKNNSSTSGVNKRSLEEDDVLKKSQVMRTLLQKRIKISDDKVENLSEQSSDDDDADKNLSSKDLDSSTKLEEDLKREIKKFMKETNNLTNTPIKLEKDLSESTPSENNCPKIKEFLACTFKKERPDTPKLQDYKPQLNDTIPEDKQSQILKSEIKLPEVEYGIDDVKTHINETQRPNYFKTEISNEPSEERSTLDLDPDESTIETNEFEKIDDVEEYDASQVPDRNEIIVDVTLDAIREQLLNGKKNRSKNGDLSCKFRAPINPLSNTTAEAELQREITKDSFSKMEIIGQFNMGFIIGKLENDLFIIDQHATDEKYNFEILQQTTILERQKLVVPQKLELTTANKTLLLDNIDIFNKNGFVFDVQDTECGQNIFLTEIPLSKNVVFGKDDIDDLLFMLHNGTQGMCRPTRIRNMLASRACRKSVMIGSALSTQDMQRLIIHMGEIEHPWNCPHGRPTIRHLINLSLVGETSNKT